MPELLELVETQDPTDMAHAVRDPERDRGDGFLLPARKVRGDLKKPRMYPRAVMIEPVVFDGATLRPKMRRDGRGVVRRRIAEDSMHDALYETQRRLENDLGGVAGLSARHCAVSVADARNQALESRSMGRYAATAREVIERHRPSRLAVTEGRVNDCTEESPERTLVRYRAGLWKEEA